jgi:ABC-2 type transport system ATP-binding protein
VLGENGAGKTTLLDLLMGFRRRTAGTISVMGHDPESDPWESRARIAYLSEKVDVPGDWEAAEFLSFHRHFFPRFDADEERGLLQALRVQPRARAGTLSAGEARRLQIVGALAARPELVIADEITAVLDILGRRQFLGLLKERQQRTGLTVVLATNVPEGLEPYADSILLLSRGRQLAFGSMADISSGGRDLAEAVARELEAHAPPFP